MGKERKPKSLKSILPDSLDVIEEDSERSEDPSSQHSQSEVQTIKEVPTRSRRKHRRRRSLESGSNSPLTCERNDSLSLPEKNYRFKDNVRSEESESEGSSDYCDTSAVLTELPSRPSFDNHDSCGSLDKSIVAEIRKFIAFPSSPVKELSPTLKLTKRRMMVPTDNLSVPPAKIADGDTAATPLFNYDEDFDIDQVEETEAEEEQLSWRMDPSRSLSDWTLKIYNKETRQAETYHVHKNLLAVGPKKSEYFVRMFRTNSRLEVGSKVTEIYMESVAAKVVPQWLDFIYSLEDALEIDTESATGLRHLAQFFGIRVMHKKAMTFITRDLSMKNVMVYYKDSVVLADDKISEIAAKHCSENILKVDIDNELLTTVDPFFFRRLMSGPEINNQEKQYHVSRLLARYCTLNTNVLDEQSFQRLTEEQYLPLVDRNAALTLMEMEADLVLVNLDADQIQAVTNLQQRCIRDLTQNWRELGNAEEAVMNVCRKLPSTVVANILVKSIAEAKKTVGVTTSTPPVAPEVQAPAPAAKSNVSLDNTLRLEAEHALKIKALKKEHEAKIALLKKEHQKALDKSLRENEAKLLKLKDICVEKDTHIANYWNELKRFQRLPNQPDGKIIPSGLAAKPSKMPSIGNQAQDGYLLVSKGKGASSKHPVFYYNVD